MIRGIDHVTINTRDIHATRRFYTQALGLRELPKVECGNHRYYFWVLPGGGKLEIGEYDFDATVATDSSTAGGRLRHLAFEVEDIFALKAHLESLGYNFATAVEYREGLGFISGQMLDPSGVELEFLQYSDPV